MSDPRDPGTTPDGGRADARQGAPDTTGSGTDAARGQPGEMARTGGDPSAANKGGGHEPATSSQGSRTGSLLGSRTERTGMADGEPSGSSQGLAGGQDNGDSSTSKPRP